MKRDDFLNVMAMWGDAEQRSTASLIELIAAVVASKVAPPKGEEVLTFQIREGDLAYLFNDFAFDTQYQDGVMTMFLTALRPASADAG